MNYPAPRNHHRVNRVEARKKRYTRMHQVCKKDMSVSCEYLTCPFCLNQCIQAELGKTRCSLCDATLEIDDTVECVFADTDNIKLPVNGIVCGSCGLVDDHQYGAIR